MENNALRVISGGQVETVEPSTGDTPETPAQAAEKLLRERFAVGEGRGSDAERARAWTLRSKAAEAYGRSEGAKKARKAIKASVRDELTALGLMGARKARR